MRLLAALLLCLSISPALAQPAAVPADGDWEPQGWQDGSLWPYDFAPRPPTADAGTFYRTFAQPIRGRPTTTRAGVAWALEKDRRTGIVYPRIVALPHGQSPELVNRSMSAVHGWLIRTALDYERLFREDPERVRFEPRLERGELLVLSDVAVTYVSARYFGVVETGIYPDGTAAGDYRVRSLTFDLRRGASFTVEPCPAATRQDDPVGGEPPPRTGFVFGPLQVCTARQVTAFFDQWRAQYRRAIEATGLPADHEPCTEASWKTRGEPFTLFLTSAGLAVRNLSVRLGRRCTETTPEIDPVVIPYRKLASLLRASALTDELLK